MEAGLNLARKWRSKDFSQIVGQELSVRLLKNSLYKNQFFPVYLFSGQRGCGKTTTARVFAAALNCENLSKFQKDPQSNKLPCLECYSCLCIKAGNHPDFIEIDAASNTGVDNVRQIIDSASFLPILGRKKIYLIDEAHMLSKAAFNALLKILEEPPVNVVFILATTDPQKIIDTVRSRCFQLFFAPVNFDLITDHLEVICHKENIKFEKPALLIISRESEGSLRDAINLLERVRLASEIVDDKTVCDILGHLQESKILELLDLVLNKNQSELLIFIDSLDLQRYSLAPLWKKFVELLCASIWLKNNIILESHAHIKDNLEKVLFRVQIQKLIMMLEVSYEYEQSFSKTSAPQVMLQMMLLKMSTLIVQENKAGNAVNINSVSNNEIKTSQVLQPQVNNIKPVSQVVPQAQEQLGPWEKVIQNLNLLNDPLVASIFKQGKLLLYDKDLGNLEISFPGELSFFAEQLESSKNTWKPFVAKIFERDVNFTPVFDKFQEKKTSINSLTNQVNGAVALNNSGENSNSSNQNGQNNFSQKRVSSNLIDVIDKQKWQKTHTVLSVFPGKITQIN